MIRTLLLSRPSYVKEIHNFLAATITEMGYKPPTYDSTRKMIYTLKKLGLIRLISTEKAKPYFPRHYYAVVPEQQKSPYWRNPHAALFKTPEEFRKMGELPQMVTPKEWMKRIRG